MVVLDTDVVIGVLRGDAAAIKKMEGYQKPLCVTSITVFELLRGVHRSRHPDKERAKLLEAISSVYVIDFGYLDAESAAKNEAALMKRGAAIGLLDTMIAGICLSTKETLVTRNAKHFSKIKGLNVETW